MTLRNLTREEITRLQEQGCTATDWQSILVATGFNTDYIQNTRFSGSIRLGKFDHEFILAGGLSRHSGLYHVTIHNCTIGDGVLIENVSNYIANYDIGDQCFIQNADLIVTEGKSTFGNGTEVAVLNETGGREVPIYNELSAHLAYIIALYRHSPVLIENLKKLIEKYTENVATGRGNIGKRVCIANTGTIRNVIIGDDAILEGVSRLHNGSVNSNSHAPVYMGHNVIAEDFIISSGSRITDGAVLVRCFIGQSCHLGHLFSAHDSFFSAIARGKTAKPVLYLPAPLL